MKQIIVSLLGRPNVGKSTLFNLFHPTKKAIVHKTPGVTRDRKIANVKINDINFQIIDTPGLESMDIDGIFAKNDLLALSMQQTLIALSESDIICYVFDSFIGILSLDYWFLNKIRQNSKKVIIVINKSEKRSSIDSIYYELGFENLIFISAKYNIGIKDFFDLLLSVTKNININVNSFNNSDIDNLQDLIDIKNNINITICGKPNVGKSTFVNTVLKKQRMIVGDYYGLTRESIENKIIFNQYNINLIDTAGIRRKNETKNQLGLISKLDTIDSIKNSDIIIFMFDAMFPLEHQDFNIINLIIKYYKSVVIVINKFDLIKNKEFYKKTLLNQINNIGYLRGVKILFISCNKYSDTSIVLNTCISLFHDSNIRINTGKLNKWLNMTVKNHQLSISDNKKFKIKYITQVSTNPLTFKLFCNDTKIIPVSYEKYLINSFKKAFNLSGTAIKLFFIKSHNPYV